MIRGRLFTLAALVAACSMLVAQDVESLVRLGRGHLVGRDPFLAHKAFAGALALAPEDETANFFVAVTRLLALSGTPGGSAFLDKLGFTASGRNPWGWRSTVPANSDGSPVPPENMSASELSDALRSLWLPALQASGSNLAKITSPGFELTLASIETGLDTVTVDLGDVLMLRAMIRVAEYGIHTVHSWNLDVQLTTVAAYLAEEGPTLEMLLQQHPGLLTFSTLDDLTFARDALIGGIDTYLDASMKIHSRPSHLTRLFTYDPEMANDEARFRQTAEDVKASLQAPVVLRVRTNLTVHLPSHFRGEQSVRSFLPTLKANAMLAGTLPDPTLDGLVTGLSRPVAEALLDEVGVPIVTTLDYSGRDAEGGFQISFNTVAGHMFVLERSTDLVAWEEVAALHADGEPYTFVGAHTGSAAPSFYRLTDLYECVRLTGRIYDSCSGKPVQGAVVSTDSDPHTAKSDAEGRYVLQTRLRPESGRQIQCTVTAGGYVTQQAMVWIWEAAISLSVGVMSEGVLAPVNDEFADRIVLEGFPVTVQGTTCAATREEGDPSFYESVWYSWTAPQSAEVAVVSAGASCTIYEGNTLNALRLLGYGYFKAVAGVTYSLGCDSGGSWPFTLSLVPRISLTLDEPPGGAVLSYPGPIMIGGTVSGLSSEPVDFEILANWSVIASGQMSGPKETWSLTWTPPKLGSYYFDIRISDRYGQFVYGRSQKSAEVRPLNDSFAAATELVALPASQRGSNQNASEEEGEPQHGRASVWWRWTAADSGLVTLSVIGDSRDADSWSLNVYKGGSLPTLTSLETVEAAFQSEKRVSFDVEAGTTYHFALAGETEDSFHLKLSAGGAPRLVILEPAPLSVYRMGDTLTVRAQSVGANGVLSSVTFLLDGKHWVTDAASPFETTLSVPEAGYRGLQGVGVDSAGVTAFSEEVTIQVVPVNDNFNNATRLEGDNLSITASNRGATLESGESLWGDLGYSGGASIWWQWTAPSDGMVTIHGGFAEADDSPAGIGVFSGDAISALSVVAREISKSGRTQISFSAKAGKLYWIAFDGAMGDEGPLMLNLQTESSMTDVQD